MAGSDAFFFQPLNRGIMHLETSQHNRKLHNFTRTIMEVNELYPDSIPLPQSTTSLATRSSEHIVGASGNDSARRANRAQPNSEPDVSSMTSSVTTISKHTSDSACLFSFLYRTVPRILLGGIGRKPTTVTCRTSRTAIQTKP
jgi:hypothetical protein